jgi:integrase
VIRQRGKGVWQIRLETGADPSTGERGKPDYRTFHGTKREAQAEEARLRLEMTQGTYIRQSKLTVREYLRESLESAPSLRPRTYEGYESIIRVHLVPSLGSILLSELRPIHLQKYYAEKRASGLSECTVLHHHRYFHGALDKAVKLQLIPNNPAARVTAPRVTRMEPQALSEKQLKAVLDATTGSELEIPTLLATVTGMRRGEVLGLPWENVNLEDGFLIIGQTLQKLKGGLTIQPPKTARSARVVSLPSFATRRLRIEKSRVQLALGKDSLDGILVCRRSSGVTWEPGWFSAVFTRAMQDVGLLGVHFHTLRHAQASLLIRKGLDIQATGTRLGHSTATTTLNLYAHTIQETDRTAARILDRALGGSLNGKKKVEVDPAGAKMVPIRAAKSA